MATTTERAWWLRLVDRSVGSGPVPVSLGGQFRRNVPLYVVGTIMLLGQQYLMARRDFFVKDAVDAIGTEHAVTAAIWILVVSIGAMATRLISRVTIFTGGRNVEYELRQALLAHLHRLGPSFFAKVPTGEIMSRATNDLQQVRLLLGFGILNVASSTFALVSALWVMLAISWKLTLASLAIFPLLMLLMRSFAIAMFTRVRENQDAIGKMSDRVLASLSGIRIVRSFAMEDAELAAFEQTNDVYLDKSLRLARLRGAM